MKKRPYFILIISLFFCLQNIHAQSNFVASESSVTFKIKNMGVMVNGKLGSFEVQAKFDKSDLSNSSLKASLKVETIDTGIKARDKHLKNEDYFEVDKYPNIKFSSSSITKTDKGYQAEGKLTIKNKTKTVKIPFVVKENSGKSTLSGSFTINRLDYDVGESSWIMSNNVAIKINCVLK